MDTKDKKTKKVKVRGTGCYDPETKKFGFEPFNEAPSTQTEVKKCLGGGKTWITTGADPSRMVSLKCKASAPDQYGDLVSQFNALTKDLKLQKPVTLPDNLRVVNESGLECWLDETKNEMTFRGTVDLSKNCRNWQAEVLKQVQLVVRRLPASERFNKIINQIKNGGNN
jgi:hypothetical protein